MTMVNFQRSGCKIGSKKEKESALIQRECAHKNLQNKDNMVQCVQKLSLSPPMESLFFFPCSVTPSLLPLRNPPILSLKNPNSSSSSSAHLFRCYSTKWRPRRGSESGGSYWNNSNAGTTFRNERSKFSFEEDEEEEDDDDDDDSVNGSWFRRKEKQRRGRNWWADGNSMFSQGSEVLEDAIDNVWIFKVFSAFGWLLPAIIISFLLATGPKAFLMALALPLGQTAISYALDKVFGRTSDNPKPRSRTKRKPFSRATKTTKMTEEEQEEENPETSKGSSGYQSWMAPDEDSVEKKNNQQDPSFRRDTSFGGWDDLDKQGKFDKGPTRRPTRATGGRPRAEVKGKLSRRGKSRSTPLLLRLLIAVFPFLGSWTRML